MINHSTTLLGPQFSLAAAKLSFQTSGKGNQPPSQEERDGCYWELVQRMPSQDDHQWMEYCILRAQQKNDAREECECILKAACANLAHAREFLSQCPFDWKAGGFLSEEGAEDPTSR